MPQRSGFKDGSSISFAPKRRRSRRTPILLGSALILAGLIAAGAAAAVVAGSAPGGGGSLSASGRVLSYVSRDGATRAQVTFTDVQGQTVTAYSSDPVTAETVPPGNEVTVYYQQDAETTVFVDGLDHSAVPMPMFVFAAGLAAVGAALALFGPGTKTVEVKERVEFVPRSGTKADRMMPLD